MAIYLGLAFLGGWLLFITWIVWSMRNHYFNLVARTKKERIDEMLDAILLSEKKSEHEISLLKKEITEMSHESLSHLNKIGLVRFNPFGKRGGEQSFVISLVNSHKDGLVINYIYTPDGLRAYPKRVKAGDGQDNPLTEEEKKAIA
ncbi:DUF4446 family protein [Candidatus Roizmanbacteria bacterium]|nr:DUF4446 family protein [Candidatus Roizmanbacteria bacterium]